MIEGSIFRIIRVLIRNEQRKREMIDFRIINKIAIYFLPSFCTRKQETSRRISVKYLIELKKQKKKQKTHLHVRDINRFYLSVLGWFNNVGEKRKNE